MSERKRIGRSSDLASRQIIYQTDEGLEVDDFDQFEISRKRVFFDDVQLVTHHRRFGVLFLVVMLLIATPNLIAAFTLLRTEPGVAAFFAIFAAPFVIAFFLRLLLRQDVITVYGRRSKAALRFTFRKQYASEKFDEICEAARRIQSSIAAEQLAAEKKTGEMQLPPEVLLPPEATDELQSPLPPGEGGRRPGEGRDDTP